MVKEAANHPSEGVRFYDESGEIKGKGGERPSASGGGEVVFGRWPSRILGVGKG